MYGAMFDCADAISNLDAQESVGLVDRILRHDARITGIDAEICVPSAINEPDGGVDGTVRSPENGKIGAIKDGLAYYQIKSGRYGLGKIKDMMLLSSGDVKPRIKECFDNGGTFVIVLTGNDSPDAQAKVRTRVRDALGAEYADARVDVWTQSTIKKFLEKIPALRLEILGIKKEWFRFYSEWSGQGDMSYPLVAGKEQEEFVERLRGHLADVRHMRVLGAPGIGKTRLVCESMKEFSGACIYTDTPYEFLHSEAFGHVMYEERSGVILVVDECDQYQMTELDNRAWRQDHIRLITIYNEPADTPHRAKLLDVPPLDDAHITKILEVCGLPHGRAVSWSKACGSSPRAAIIVGTDLLHNPTDVYRPASVNAVWERYIASRTKFGTDEFRLRKKVLMFASLFRSFGFDKPHERELEIMKDILERHAGISGADFVKTIKKLKDMKILQGGSRLYITPKVLHAWLLQEWGDEYGDLDPFDLGGGGTGPAHTDTLGRMADTLTYLRGTPGADRIIKNVFGSGGLAEKHDLPNGTTGAELFDRCSRVDPPGALDYVERRFVNGDHTLKPGAGKWRAARALARMAVTEASLFDRAARCLISLAQPENGRIGDDMVDEFLTLFVATRGTRDRTPLTRRLQTIRETLASRIPRVRQLGISACRAAMETDHVSRDTYPGPASEMRAERISYYQGVLETIRECMESFRGEDASALRRSFLNSAHRMMEYPELADTTLSVLERARDGADTKQVIETAAKCQAMASGLPRETQRRWDAFRRSIAGSDYHALLESHVGVAPIPDDTHAEVDRRGDITRELARQSLDIRVLKPELRWLVTRKAVNGWEFGRALGNADVDFSLLPHLLEAQRESDDEPGASFLGGYASAMFQRDVSRWEMMLDELAGDASLRFLVPETTYLSGMTIRAARRISRMLESGMDPRQLAFYAHGTCIDRVPESEFAAWIRALSGKGPEGYAMALMLYARYYLVPEGTVPEHAATLLFSGDNYRRLDGARYAWAAQDSWLDILKAHVIQNGCGPKPVLDAITFLHEHRANPRHKMHAAGLLEAVAEHAPPETWAGILDRALQNHMYLWIKLLLSKNPDTISRKVPREAIFRWVDEDTRRAPVAAYVFTADLPDAVLWISRYGNDQSLMGAIDESLDSVMVVGPMSAHYKREKERAATLRETQEDPRVRRWLEHRIRHCEERMTHWRARSN